MKRKLVRVVLCLSASLAAALAQSSAGQAPLPFVSPIFGDSMVLQRGKPNTIWGWSQPGDTVRVEIAESSAIATDWADAPIEGNTVIVSSRSVPFRTDDWPGITEGRH